MNAGKTIFSQVMDFLPLHEFRQCVHRYQGDYKTKSFSCLDQFLCMGFAQMTYRESLRDIETCLRSMQSKQSRPFISSFNIWTPARLLSSCHFGCHSRPLTLRQK